MFYFAQAGTEKDVDPSGSTAGATVTFDLTGEPTYESTGFGDEGFSNLSGYRWRPDGGFIVSPSAGVGLKLEAAPDGLGMSMSVGIKWLEIGG